MAETNTDSHSHINSRLLGYFKDYEQVHKTFGNEICHMVGIPLILTTLLGMLSKIQLGYYFGIQNIFGFGLDGGTLIWFFATIWYFALDYKLALPFSMVVLMHYFIGTLFSWPFLIGIFVLGWVFQFIGHYKYEKKSPAFYKNLNHLLVGPLWFFARAIKYYSK